MIENIGTQNQTWIDLVGWTLVHSCWQLLLVAFLFWIGRFILEGLLTARDSSFIYAWACVCLLACSLFPIGTWAFLNSTNESTQLTSLNLAESTVAFTGLPSDELVTEIHSPNLESQNELSEVGNDRATNAPNAAYGKMAELFPWLVPAWIVGVFLASVRPLAGLYNVRRLRTFGQSDLPDSIIRIGNQVAGQLGVKRAIRFVQSTLVQVPTVIGFFKPVILLPASVTTGLSSTQIEQILAHELAHIRRHDYLVNLIQTLVESVFFFHPAVWWISRQIRIERENCCDDSAIEQYGNQTDYVSALLLLENLRASAPPALSSNGGSLITRVRRILEGPKPSGRGHGLGNGITIPASGMLALSIAIGAVLSMSEINVAAEVGQANSNRIDGGVARDAAAKPETDNPLTQLGLGLPSSNSGIKEAGLETENGSDTVLATVNGVEIKASILANHVYMTHRQRILEKLIEAQVIKAEAIKSGILPFPKAAVDAEVKRLADKIEMTTERYLDMLMREQGITKIDLAEKQGIKYWIDQLEVRDPKKFQAKIDQLKENAKIERVMSDPVLSKKHPDVAAFVNNERITLEDVRSECIRMLGKHELNSLISMTILTSQVKLQNLELTQHEMSAQAARSQKLQTKMPPVPIKESEWMDTVLARQIYPTALLRKLAEPVEVLEQDIWQAYSHDYGVRANVLAITTNTRKDALKVWQLAQSNPTKAHFQSLARRYATEANIRKNEGAVPPIQKYGEFPALEKAAFDLQPGQISAIVELRGKGESKFVVLYSLGLELPKNPPSVDEVKSEITELVREAKTRESMMKKFEELKDAANIKRENFSIKTLLEAPRLQNKHAEPHAAGSRKRHLAKQSGNAANLKLAEALPSFDQKMPAKPKVAATDTEPAPGKQEKLVTKTYAVADLIVPLTQTFNTQMEYEGNQWVPMTLTNGQAKSQFAKVDYEVGDKDAQPLADLIQNTIAPDSWSDAKVGGVGTIQFYDKSISLIISQTNSVHDEVQEMLKKLRELNEVTIELRGYLVSCKKDTANEVMLRDIPDLNDSVTKTTTPLTARFMQGIATAKKEIELVTLPNMTVFNGQNAQLRIKELGDNGNFSFHFTVVTSPDGKSIRGTAIVSKESGQAQTNLETVFQANSSQPTIFNLSDLVKNPEEDLLLLVIKPIVIDESQL